MAERKQDQEFLDTNDKIDEVAETNVGSTAMYRDPSTDKQTLTSADSKQTSAQYGTSEQQNNSTSVNTTGFDFDEDTLSKYDNLVKRMPDGVANAFKEVYPQEPGRKLYDDKIDNARKRAKIANIAESMRLLIDMGSGFSGGNVYKRDEVAKNVASAKKDADDADKAYQAAVKEYRDKLYDARRADANARQNLYNQLVLNTRKSTTNSQSDTTGATRQAGITQSKQNTNQRVWDDITGVDRGKGNKDEKQETVLIQLPVATYDKNGNKTITYKDFKTTEKRWKELRGNLVSAIVSNPTTVKELAKRFNLDEDTVKSVVRGDFVGDDESKKANITQQEYMLKVAMDLNQELVDRVFNSEEVDGSRGVKTRATVTSPSQTNEPTRYDQWGQGQQQKQNIPGF